LRRNHLLQDDAETLTETGFQNSHTPVASFEGDHKLVGGRCSEGKFLSKTTVFVGLERNNAGFTRSRFAGLARNSADYPHNSVRGRS
jgi:hypothetical protein